MKHPGEYNPLSSIMHPEDPMKPPSCARKCKHPPQSPFENKDSYTGQEVRIEYRNENTELPSSLRNRLSYNLMVDIGQTTCMCK